LDDLDIIIEKILSPRDLERIRLKIEAVDDVDVADGECVASCS
jgi:hypothetical protein